ncbi:MAG TPA: penicillin-binding transpeptidase domain-containing protein [Marmoricola sp.]|nr:penicillin-binding transpeptidase domain-containing protein [Marmoricola sp.]
MTMRSRQRLLAVAMTLVAVSVAVSACGSKAPAASPNQPIPTSTATPTVTPVQMTLVGKPSKFEYADGSPINMSDPQSGFIAQMASAQLFKLGFSQAQIDSGGMNIVTTITRDAMAAAANAVHTSVPAGVSDLKVATASVNVRNGALLGFYAGQDFKTSTYNWALAPNPVGSLFKVPALAMALSNGMTLHSMFNGNSPLPIGGGVSVSNQAQVSGQATSYGHRVSLLSALQFGINTAFVDMTMDTPGGALNIADMAVAMGVPANVPGLIRTTSAGLQIASPTIALGATSVSPVDIANAYATVANDGAAHPWHVVDRVLDTAGNQIWKVPARETLGMSTSVAGDVVTAMRQVVAAGTGSKAQGLGRPAAGMTGIATGMGNQHVITSWFAGFTPEVSTAVMYLRADPHTGAYLPLDGALPSYFGGDYPTLTWVSVMKDVLSTLPTAH